jgi:hypothetical protein
MAQGWARGWWVTSCAGIPSRRQRRRSRPGAGVHVVQPLGAPHGPLPLASSQQGRRRDGIPAPLMSCGSGTPRVPVILVRAHRVPVPTGIHGELPALADRSSLTVHGNTFPLTPCGSPLLCKAEPRTARRATRVPLVGVSSGHQGSLLTTAERLVEPSARGWSGEQLAGAGTGQNGLPLRGGKGQHRAISTELAVSDTTQPGRSVMTSRHSSPSRYLSSQMRQVVFTGLVVAGRRVG